VLAAVVAVLLVRQRAMLDAGTDSLAGADAAWLALAGAGTVLLWTAGTVSQLGSIPARVPVLRLFAVQVAATFANHLLPAGSGGMAVNLRFLHRHGLSRGTAVSAVALNLLAGLVTHTVLLVTAVLLAPGPLAAAISRGGGHPGAPGGLGPHGAWVAAAAGLLLAALAVWAARRSAGPPRGWWARTVRRLTARVLADVAGLAVVLRSPVRAAQLWLGSLAVPVLHCLTLYAVLRSLGGTVPLVPLSMAYLVASAVAAVLPSPGGFGALDVALVGGLVAVGAPAAGALATVLTYRLLTVWLPLLPGACVLAVLVRRRVI
jgi:uncharacterized membrane protein YbhN (UPF0104 family)